MIEDKLYTSPVMEDEDEDLEDAPEEDVDEGDDDWGGSEE